MLLAPKLCVLLSIIIVKYCSHIINISTVDEGDFDEDEEYDNYGDEDEEGGLGDDEEMNNNNDRDIEMANEMDSDEDEFRGRQGRPNQRAIADKENDAVSELGDNSVSIITTVLTHAVK